MIALSCSELARVGPPRPSGPPTLIARMVSRGSILRSHVSGVCLLTAYNKDKRSDRGFHTCAATAAFQWNTVRLLSFISQFFILIVCNFIHKSQSHKGTQICVMFVLLWAGLHNKKMGRSKMGPIERNQFVYIKKSFPGFADHLLKII